MYACGSQKSALDPHGAGVTRGCELLNVGTDTRTPVLEKPQVLFTSELSKPPGVSENHITIFIVIYTYKLCILTYLILEIEITGLIQSCGNLNFW